MKFCILKFWSLGLRKTMSLSTSINWDFFFFTTSKYITCLTSIKTQFDLTIISIFTCTNSPLLQAAMCVLRYTPFKNQKRGYWVKYITNFALSMKCLNLSKIQDLG